MAKSTLKFEIFEAHAQPVDILSSDPTCEQELVVELLQEGVVRLAGIKAMVVPIDDQAALPEGVESAARLVEIYGISVRSEAGWGPRLELVDVWTQLGWYDAKNPQLAGLRAYPIIRGGGAFRCKLRGVDWLDEYVSMRVKIVLVLERLR